MDRRIIFVSLILVAIPVTIPSFPVAVSFLAISWLVLIDTYQTRSKRVIPLREMIQMCLEHPFWPLSEPLHAKFSKKTDKQYAYSMGMIGIAILSIPFYYQETDALRLVSLFLYLIGIKLIGIAAYQLNTKRHHRI